MTTECGGTLLHLSPMYGVNIPEEKIFSNSHHFQRSHKCKIIVLFSHICHMFPPYLATIQPLARTHFLNSKQDVTPTAE